MQLFIAIWNWLFSRKPERSELLTQWNDPWFGHPGYKDLPPALLAEVGDPRTTRLMTTGTSASSRVNTLCARFRPIL